ncbi:MAG: methylmalonyl Co-A mutase-associated GTPase MeaB [Chloroflexota bacterium]
MTVVHTQHAEPARPGDLTLDEQVAEVLRGSRRAAGRLISRIENDSASVEPAMRALYRHTGQAHIIGMTGPPGAGKSTVADELIRVIRDVGMRVGVVAVDPNSPFSGGAILGDRIRMMRHAADRDVFIRSMGARGTLGGLARATGEAVRVMDAMQFDVILVETVGVGQSELEIAAQADTTLVIIPPGLGDGVQAIKAGIMEIADIFVINKADHPQADKTLGDIRELLHMEPVARDWTPPIVSTIALQAQGIPDLWMRIVQHRDYLERTGELERRRRRRLESEIMDIVWQRIRRRVLEPRVETDDFRSTLDQVLQRTLDPYEAAERLSPETS